MAPHHHQHGHHHGNNVCHQTLGNPYCYSSCCCSCNCSCSSSPIPHPPAISTDQLLQSMATNLLKPQYVLKPKQVHPQYPLEDLIRRVSALESSLSQLSSRKPPTPSAPPPSIRRRAPTHPLREVAAKTIQTRFRQFLVRRSQTLRDLKRLASIKSRAAALRSSVSGDDADADPEAISQEAMVLLLQLDSMQSSDPMIRDGKRSISRQLMRMLEFVEKVLVRERRVSLREMEVVEDAAPPVPRMRSAKRVSFVDNGRGIDEETKEGFSRLLEDKEEVFENINGTFHVQNGAFHVQNGDFELSAPQPLQMELRLGL